MGVGRSVKGGGGWCKLVGVEWVLSAMLIHDNSNNNNNNNSNNVAVL